MSPELLHGDFGVPSDEWIFSNPDECFLGRETEGTHSVTELGLLKGKNKTKQIIT